MSALGQKQTYALQQGMSALAPIATAKANFPKNHCPLYPRKQTKIEIIFRSGCLFLALYAHFKLCPPVAPGFLNYRKWCRPWTDSILLEIGIYLSAGKLTGFV